MYNNIHIDIDVSMYLESERCIYIYIEIEIYRVQPGATRRPPTTWPISAKKPKRYTNLDIGIGIGI